MSDDWSVIAEESAADARMYLITVREIAAGNSPDDLHDSRPFGSSATLNPDI